MDGEYVPLEEIASLPDRISEVQETKRVPESAPETLWDRWWMLLLFTGLISAEWAARKLSNLS